MPSPAIHERRRSWAGLRIRPERVLRILVVALFVAAALRGAHFVLVTIPAVSDQAVGIDYRTVIGAARSYLDGDGFYPAAQLAGPYPRNAGPILYPPVTLWLFAPFVALPAFLWWAIPGALTVWAFVRLRPSAAAMAVVGLLLILPASQSPIIYGNPVMWLVPALAWGLMRGGWAVAILAKPSLAPFALAGVRRRGWWLGLALFIAASLPFGTMWFDWIVAVEHGGVPLTHSLRQVPLMLIPLVAWLGRSRLGEHDARRVEASGEGAAPSGAAARGWHPDDPAVGTMVLAGDAQQDRS